MHVDVNAKKIDNPTYKLIMYLNKYEPELLDEKTELLFKNLKTHFVKLFYMIAHINKIQKDSDFIEKYNKTSVVSISSVEYCYYKISTIFDITYQIADKLIFPRDKKGSRYDYLENKFESYSGDLVALHLNWYKNINKIRNKIVHGGIVIQAFYIDDENIKKRICFQAYNSELDDLVEPHYAYSNINNNNINFADNYFVFYTHILYSYLFDFFEFVLIELSAGKNYDLENLSLNHMLYENFERSQKTWTLSEIDIFCEITREMIALLLAKGHINNIDKVRSESVDELFFSSPFTMMSKISKGDWRLEEK